MKTDNILYRRTCTGLEVVLSDFGCARWSNNEEGEDVVGGTLTYMSPEVLTGRYSSTQLSSIDIWGAGAVFAELVRSSLS